MNNISTKNIVFLLIIIGIISLGLKLYTIDFSVSEIQDTWIYVLRGIAFSNGDYAESPIKPSGYPLILSFFFKIFEPENFVDYVNIARVLNIIISSATIFPLYLLGRHFLDKKFSLLLSFFFAFQPQLNFNVGLGISEPIFLLFLILSYHFLLKSNSKFTERFKNLVKKLNFPKIHLSADYDNSADLILKDRKHLDNNPKIIEKSDIINLLKKINEFSN